MNSRVSWSVDGIDPSVRERAEAAARRAGMSLNDWLNSTVGEPSPPDWRMEQRQPMPSRESREVADIHQRLDAITRQIEQIAKPVTRAEAVRAEVPRGQPAVARQLNDAISRLDARLSQISRPQPAREPQPQLMRESQMQREPQMHDRQLEERLRQAEAVERAAAQVYRPSPPLSPASFDSAIAEIAARQNELDVSAQRQMPPRGAPPMAAYAPPPGPDFSSLERHLLKITSQIEALQRPDHIEQSIAAFRGELAEIRQAITEAMPRRAIESIENEIRSLHHRIDEIRQEGRNGQGQAIAGIERALSEIREALRTLTPAEQLTGYDEAIRNLGAKLDMILRANDDPSTVHQLESAIAALRAIVSNVASNDALLQLSGDVHALAAKVDQLSQMSRAETHGDAFAGIEQRIAALASTLETRERPAGYDNTDAIEGALRSLSERIDRLQVGNDSSSAFTHLEQRVSYLLERLESADQRSGNLGRVEEGLHDIMRHLEAQHAHIASLADAARNVSSSPQPMMDSGIVDMVKRELSDIRFSQSETDRRTQDSLETVHNTLGHVVDRLAMIENDLRTVRTAPPAPAPAESRMEAPRIELPRAAMSQPIAQPKAEAYKPESYRPELPNPALAQEHFMSAPREFHAAQPVESAPPPPLPPRAISEILEPHAASARAAIAPELPPDHPLEPGTRPSGRVASPSERIADSERAISDLPAGKKEPVSTSSFIAAARRAAQAAAAQPVNEKAARAASKAAAKAKEKADKAAKAVAAKAGTAAAGATATGAPEAQPSTITSKIRSLLVGASVVVILLSTAKMAMNLLDTSSAPQMPAIEHSEPATQPMQPPAENSAAPAPAAPSGVGGPSVPGPSMTSPTPLGRQSNNTPAPNTLDSAQVTIPPATAPAPAAAPEPAATPTAAANDVTGTIPTAPPLGGKLAMVQIPAGEKLPDAIGGPALRSAAIKGDAAAAYEVGVRFAEGKGVTANVDEAAKWYGRAAQAGVVPAMFRLGTFYEKGLSVKRDFDVARRYYVQAAERGNAKAMHNLAVLDADGGGKGADYKSAAQWFRKAADRGVADSQVNLGILYARGIGVEQNLAESFKWFSLAAAQGDADAGHKRDDIAKRLDPQSLAAAKLAIQTFTAEPQPSDAVNVPAPAGGWDGATAQPAAAKPVKQPSKRTAALAAPAR
ncbi:MULTISPECIES: tetratricopeptide repeat protein [Bradyrhizobium]|jgi:localization factor PodJL|uniref:tetratricopeptide repeat protein n=1 Tax=Bradyrhizobium TaxID=374 RepID=UPI000487F775|nr:MULTISPECIES: tetratricopeptide repeat protein [Bradyrhizobium]MCS3445739.1 localization factor PodJL [Bradyrhizobium elkanii]MCS3563130.1 localization factor PodJL [Bradyrhizobium elkanii]MCW2147035.1 localization factor PodJL [Bradyrhizobium elkanii]MCW2353890.1 localization factor PodJL [Bradyrhizobium elkanii]MCW2379865.1 localization factor PodJL [Bradyrhizobium elkanii]